MNDENNKNHYLSLMELITESLLRDLILFTFLFILIIAQVWDSVLLLLFPLVTFAFSLFFRILSNNKIRTEFNNSLIIYNPLGEESKHANRFFFCTLFQLILILWLGGESLYNSHIINSYFSYFLGFLIFLYTFSFFWVFIDSWKNTKIEIIPYITEGKSSLKVKSQDLSKVISYLKLKNFKVIAITTLLVFITLNILNIISLLFINNNMPGIQVILPGTQILTLSYLFYGFLTISPILTIILLNKNYKTINTLSKEKFEAILDPLPRNIQIKIRENLKTLNNKFKEQLKNQ